MTKSVVALLILTASALPAHAQKSGKWTVGFGQGLIEHAVTNGPGNRFMVVCDEGYSENAERTSLSFTIRDREPPPKSTVRVFVGDEEFTFYADQYSETLINNRAAHSNFVALWEDMARGSGSIRVLFEDGRTSTFSLDGARKALGKKPCADSFTTR